jgi:hypothetical protein
MPRLQALELVPDEDGCAAVRRDWQALHDAGLPSQLDHRGATNAPHLTVVSALALPAEAVELATTVLGAILPVSGRYTGLLLLGRRRVTLARALQLDDDVVAQVLQMRLRVRQREHQGWVPHVTLARGLDGGMLTAALGLLGREDAVLSFTELRLWDPGTGTVSSLAARR